MEEFTIPDYAVMTGRSTKSGIYFTEGERGLELDSGSGARAFRYPGAKIADFREIPVAVAILEEALKRGSAYGKEYSEARLDLLGFHLGFGEGATDLCLDWRRMTRRSFETLGLAQHAKRLGYDGARVWGKDDLLAPTSVCIWNTELVEPITDEIWQ